MTLHGSCAARDEAAVLILGPSGSGKSDLLLRLIDRGFLLVADDQVLIESGWAQPPPSLAGLIEIRGLGLVRLPHRAPVKLALVVSLDPSVPRLPEPRSHPTLAVPIIGLDPHPASAPIRVALALDGALGRLASPVGAFAA